MQTSIIYLNGQLALNFPELVKISVEPNQMATAQIVVKRIKFEYCGLDRALGFAKVQSAIGKATALRAITLLKDQYSNLYLYLANILFF